MIIPIRCFTCGKVIGNKWEAYIELLRCEYTEGDALDTLGLRRYCCRRMLLSHVDLIEKLLNYTPLENMTNLSDNIIKVFLTKQVLALKDSDISLSLVAQGVQCYKEEVRCHVQSLSPALFQLSINKDNTTTIRIDPTIDICDNFLARRCHNTVKICDKLHLCREFGHCKIPQCRFPHDFTRGQNRRIVQQMNCADINCELLVKLIRLKKYSERKFGSTESLSKTRNSIVDNKDLSKEADINKQIDVSFPSIFFAKQIDMEIIEMILCQKNIRIEKKFKECENEYFRRSTLQLEEKSDVDELLATPILTHDHVDFKIKRTKQLTDRTCFVLKILVSDQQNKVDENRVKLYISLLVGNSISYRIFNLSISDEKAYLVQCNNDIDFDRIRQQYETRRQLQGRDVTLMQIHEYDTASIYYIDEHKTMKYDDLENILQSVRKYVFTFQLVNEYCAEVEFINSVAFKEWMSVIEKVKDKYRVNVEPIIQEVDDGNYTENSSSSTTENIPFNFDKPNLVSITLRSEWSMVAAHPVFQLEYKDYIRTQLGGEININQNEVTYTGDLPRLPRASNNLAILANKTNNFMQKFKYQQLRDLKPYHVNILRANSNIVAFSRTERNDYMIAARPQDLFELRGKLFPKPNQNFQTDRRNPPRNYQPDNRLLPVPLMQQEIVEPPSSSLPAAKPANTSSIFPITKAEEMNMFLMDKFEERLQEHLKEICNVNIIIERHAVNDKVKGDKTRIRIKLTGEMNDVESALNDLSNLFSSLRTREFNDKTDGNWTKIEEVVDLIQHHFALINLHALCQRISPTCLHVYFFDVTNPQFGIDEQKIDDIINNQFSLATIIHNQRLASAKFIKEWTDLEEKIRKQDNYKKDICFSREADSFYLFGLTKLVKELRQTFEQLKNKYIPQACKISLSDKQLNFLRYVAKTNLNKIEKQYKGDGCDISLTRLEQHGHFLAPVDMHSRIKDTLEALVQITETKFEIRSNGFENLINQEPKRLFSLVKAKCYLVKNVRTQRSHISVPKSQAADPEDAAQASQSTHNANATSINIGKSAITIASGDLTAQKVDVIVVCSTSEILCRAILTAAGPQVKAEYGVSQAAGQQHTATSNGLLPCKEILFIPWRGDQSDLSSLKKTLGEFVSTAIKYAFENGRTSLAFPSVGCGKLGFDPSIIAQHMIDETEAQLISSKSTMNVSFILVQEQQNVYDAFVKYLNTIQTNVAQQSSKSKTSQHLKIPYDEKIIEITLIGSNNAQLDQCKNDILELANACLFKTRLTDKQDMMDWSQNTISTYYDHCLKQHVIPTLNFNTLSIELVGPKDAVREAEKHFYELTTETLKAARIHAVSRGIIWSVEVTPNSDTWEQYSFKLNGLIEDAYLKKLVNYDFVNDKQERCRIVFSNMEEFHGTDVRRIRRKVVDSLLPDTWEPSDQNCKRVVLQSSSKEYRDVSQQFAATMRGQYTQIVKIERIQNERWFKQYAAHRDDFKQRYKTLDERLLFHGCDGTSANKIAQECFNRSFAGVHGVAYGCGVYFHSHANYSHSYAKPDISGQRTMFLARVLIGKTCRGNQGMKTPLPGHDTTTDGQHIFVIYHDAGAYADHLITYQ
ncbi:unnamed protein product [Rotaria magnacalcarata]|uniref:Poly [ADP-ribose] polymerase n=1 Tax=Rotaria magnacalcarata TaxID=392030 RepID=A0A815PN45_9BILA|nr:unnamed protein product [Rotaria magnacalcarata]